MLITGIANGVTHMLISPDGNLLHTGFRKVDANPQLYMSVVICLSFSAQHDLIQSWDLRSPGKVLYEMNRGVCTNQRIYFDLYE